MMRIALVAALAVAADGRAGDPAPQVEKYLHPANWPSATAPSNAPSTAARRTTGSGSASACCGSSAPSSGSASRCTSTA